MKKAQYFLSFFIILAIFASAFSQPPNPKCQDNQGMPQMPPPEFNDMRKPFGNPPMMLDIAELEDLMKEIGIDKDRAQKIIAITREFLSQREERMIKIQREDLNVREELLKDKPDLPAIHSMINRKTQVLAEIEFSQIKRDLDIKLLLSVSEYDHWKSVMLAKMRPMMMPPMGQKKPVSQPVDKGPDKPK